MSRTINIHRSVYHYITPPTAYIIPQNQHRINSFADIIAKLQNHFALYECIRPSSATQMTAMTRILMLFLYIKQHCISRHCRHGIYGLYLLLKLIFSFSLTLHCLNQFIFFQFYNDFAGSGIGQCTDTCNIVSAKNAIRSESTI